MNNNESPDDNDIEELFLVNFQEEDEDEIVKPRSCLIRFISLFVLIAFIAISFPLLRVLDGDRSEILKEDYSLNNDPIVQESSPAIGNIEVQSNKSGNAFVRMGTGFCISSNGKIITNYHVIEDARLVKIEFSNGGVYYSQRYRRIADTDLAIIYVNAENLPTLFIDFDSAPCKGDLVTIIGNPLGLKRIADRGKVGEYHLKGEQSIIFDIDVCARPGSSGSPVINQNGQVVGVVYAITKISCDDQSESKALAIPLSPYRESIVEDNSIDS